MCTNVSTVLFLISIQRNAQPLPYPAVLWIVSVRKTRPWWKKKLNLSLLVLFISIFQQGLLHNTSVFRPEKWSLLALFNKICIKVSSLILPVSSKYPLNSLKIRENLTAVYQPTSFEYSLKNRNSNLGKPF